MVDMTYASVDGRKPGNVRKALRGSVFAAPTSSAALTTLTVDSVGSPGTPTLNALPAGYEDMGTLSDAGAVLARAVSASDINAWGYLEPVRRDITSDVSTLQLVGLETNKQTLAVYFQVDPSTLVPNATTAELEIAKPVTPTAFYWRILVLGVDQVDAGEIYIARFLPKACLTSIGNMSFDSANDTINYDLTLTAYVDDVLGYADKTFLGGAGWQSLKTSMGF